MPTPPFAQVQASINGAANASGGLGAGFGQSVALSAPSTVGWTSAIWEIPDFPPGFSAPAGWSTSPQGVIFFQPSNPTTPPPSFNLPASGASTWGKLPIRLRINGNPLQFNADGSPNTSFRSNLTDESTSIRLSSPNLGMHGVFFGETIQYDAFRAAVGEMMQMFRVIDGAGSPGGGFIAPTGTGLVTVTGGALNPTVQALTAHAVLLGEGSATLGFATIGTAGRYLRDNGAAADPSFTQIQYSEIAGTPTVPTLPTLTAHDLVVGQGTTVPLFLAPGTVGNIVTSNGTDWVSAAPAPFSVAPLAVSGAVTLTTAQTYVEFTAGNYAITFPALPIVGSIFELVHVAGTLAGSGLTFAGNGHNVINPNNRLAAASPTALPTIDGATYRYAYNGSIWRCLGVC